MTTPIAVPTKTPLHPLMVAALIAVILACSLGVAAMLGWLPSSTGRNADAPPANTELANSSPSAGSKDLATTANPSDKAALNDAPPVAAAPAQHAAPSHRAHTAAPAQHVAIANQAACHDCGVIDAVNAVEHRGQGGAVGTAGGAILGGLLGNQVGSGNGRKLATVAGAIGGAVAGNQIEGNMNKTTTYNIVVRLSDGSTRTFHQSSQPAWRPGDHVRIVNGALQSEG